MNRYIFICGNLYPHQIGGLEVFNHYLIKELGRSTQVLVVSHQKRPSDISKNDFIKVPTFPPHGLFFSVGIFFRFLFSKLKDTKIVVSFSKAHWVNWLPYIILKKLRNLKYVVVIHSGDLGNWKDKAIHRSLFTNSYTLFGVSAAICDAYAKTTNKTVYYLPPLIPFKVENSEKLVCREALGIIGGKKVILMVGSLRKIKNPILSIEALNLLGKKLLGDANILLAFVGDGDLRPELEKRVETLGIGQFVHFFGYQPREKIPLFLKASDVYLITSEHEGQPLSLLEALLYPIEIIGSDATGIKSILDGFGGNVFERGNPAALANLLKSVLLDPNYASKYPQSNSYFHQNFDYQNVLNTFLEKTG